MHVKPQEKTHEVMKTARENGKIFQKKFHGIYMSFTQTRE